MELGQQSTLANHSRNSDANNDLNEDNHYAQLARKHWLGSSRPSKLRHIVIKEELWDRLEQESFPHGSLMVLESLQVLEKYLWPGYTENSSNYEVLLLALIVNAKFRENVASWGIFSDRPSDFSSFFRRVLSLSIDQSLSLRVRTNLVTFVIYAFQSLDNSTIRKECAPLVSIAIWSNLHGERAREAEFERNPSFRKAWRAMLKRQDTSDEAGQIRLVFERSWLFTLLMDLLNQAYTDHGENRTESLLYCERVLELIIDLQSQLPTRRYVNCLVRDLHLLTAIKLSPMFDQDDLGLLRDLLNLLRHYSCYPIDEATGEQLPAKNIINAHNAKLARLQRITVKHFNKKLSILALSNYASLENPTEFEGHLEVLEPSELIHLCMLLELRTEYPQSTLVVLDRPFFLEILLSEHERRPGFQDTVRQMPTMPTEKILYEETFLRNESYDGSRPLAIPKLNLQYLSVGDFLWRSFILFRCESFYEIRKYLESTIKRLQPRLTATQTRFEGFSRMALPISKPAILDVAPEKVGESVPSQVRAEVIMDVRRLNPSIRREWESLRPDDVVFLLAVHPFMDGSSLTNGHSKTNFQEKAGIKHLRTAEVIQVQDENGRPLRDYQSHQINGETFRPSQRRLILKLDAKAYKEDIGSMSKGQPDVYQSINLIVRRRGRENNFKPILESIRRLTLSDVPIPSWLQEVFLGYGDPSSSSFERLPNRLKSIDFRDTFLDWQHLIQSFPGKAIEPSGEMLSSFSPPYVLGRVVEDPPELVTRPTKKRRKEEVEAPRLKHDSIRVSTYKPLNMGPYPMDVPKPNLVRFTPAQVEAIYSGTQPGLTVIIGPPGTGKTDVATQIINNIYHNFPTQRTLLIAHSNQALNQLFQKIVALDIDERHLLRLGHGEEELETSGDYSKYGRVDSFLENRTAYLVEVDRLAANLGAPGAHGSSCETASYFNSVYVQPVWRKYWEMVQSGVIASEEIMQNFPFHAYFSNAPQPLFPVDASRETIVDIIAGCYRHIEKIFSELEDIRPFEILRNARDKANYLLVQEARIIAMTSTHAAMRRQDIAALGFRYDNVVMEEAAQITEIENFIPLAMQEPKSGEMPLQRVVLCGDHLQNSPIVQNLAFKQYANLEQSLFLRFVRLSVPTIMLDQQGRARPSLAELYKWRYPGLRNLPSVETLPEFLTANAGLRYEYQFINVSEYKGKGESEPTPHFIQNLGEAEYAVAIYMYMRLLSYPASKISILAAYAGQKALIKDVLNHRCAKNRLFGLPRIVTTVDKYQGEQNDYIILSLTRTSRVGYLRDLRRLTVALSRARLGLYVLGRRELFESSLEVNEAFATLLAGPDKLAVVTGEVYPASRKLSDEIQSTEMQGVEHLGQYVFEMTEAMVAALKKGGGTLPPVAERPDDMDTYEQSEEEADVGDEPEVEEPKDDSQL